MPIAVTCSHCSKPIDDVVYELRVMAVRQNGLHDLGGEPFVQLHWWCIGRWARANGKVRP